MPAGRGEVRFSISAPTAEDDQCWWSALEGPIHLAGGVAELGIALDRLACA